MKYIDTLKSMTKTKYLSLFPPDGKYKRIFHKIKYLVSQKRNVSNVYHYNYRKIRINSGVDLPLERTKCNNIC